MFMLLKFVFLCSALQVIMYYLPLFCLFLELRLLIILFLVSTNFSFITNLVNSFLYFFPRWYILYNNVQIKILVHNYYFLHPLRLGTRMNLHRLSGKKVL